MFKFTTLLIKIKLYITNYTSLLNNSKGKLRGPKLVPS